MPNGIAYLALAVWPLVTVLFFMQLRADRALIWSLMLAYLFLPEPPAAFDMPLMPPLNKHNIPALAAFAVMLWRHGPRDSLLPEFWPARILLVIFMLTPMVTAATNADPVFFGRVGLPALTLKDGIALIVQQALLILPFLMARQHLSSGGSQRELLVALMVGGLIYSLPMLLEMRVSPQLNLWVYGYYQHLFGQSIRFGGFRPVVFLYHGLWVTFFCMTAVVSAWALWRWDRKIGNMRLMVAAVYLTMVLVMSKSMGALIFATLLVPLVLFLRPRMQVRIALVIGLLAVSYPLMKGAGLVPERALTEAAARVDDERAGSLQFRFDNENDLLDRAYEKPVFGWGSWGRNHIYDPVSGRMLTVTDGRWIILIGVYGWIGFLAEFGLLVLPLFMIWRETGRVPDEDVSPFIAPLSLLLAINVVDLLPNATLTPLTWLIAGALVGYAEQLSEKRKKVPVAPEGKGLQWQSVM